MPAVPTRRKITSWDDVERALEEERESNRRTWQDHDAQHRREAEERSREMSDAIAGAKAHFDRVAANQTKENEAQFNKVHAAVNDIGKTVDTVTRDVLSELRLAKDDRLKEATRIATIEQLKKEEKEKQKEEKEKRELETIEENAKNDATNKRIAVITALVVPIVIALIAAIWHSR